MFCYPFLSCIEFYNTETYALDLAQHLSEEQISRFLGYLSNLICEKKTVVIKIIG